MPPPPRHPELAGAYDRLAALQREWESGGPLSAEQQEKLGRYSEFLDKFNGIYSRTETALDKREAGGISADEAMARQEIDPTQGEAGFNPDAFWHQTLGGDEDSPTWLRRLREVPGQAVGAVGGAIDTAAAPLQFFGETFDELRDLQAGRETGPGALTSLGDAATDFGRKWMPAFTTPEAPAEGEPLSEHAERAWYALGPAAGQMGVVAPLTLATRSPTIGASPLAARIAVDEMREAREAGQSMPWLRGVEAGVLEGAIETLGGHPLLKTAGAKTLIRRLIGLLGTMATEEAEEAGQAGVSAWREKTGGLVSMMTGEGGRQPDADPYHLFMEQYVPGVGAAIGGMGGAYGMARGLDEELEEGDGEAGPRAPELTGPEAVSEKFLPYAVANFLGGEENAEATRKAIRERAQQEMEETARAVTGAIPRQISDEELDLYTEKVIERAASIHQRAVLAGGDEFGVLKEVRKQIIEKAQTARKEGRGQDALAWTLAGERIEERANELGLEIARGREEEARREREVKNLRTLAKQLFTKKKDLDPFSIEEQFYGLEPEVRDAVLGHTIKVRAGKTTHEMTIFDALKLRQQQYVEKQQKDRADAELMQKYGVSTVGEARDAQRKAEAEESRRRKQIKQAHVRGLAALLRSARDSSTLSQYVDMIRAKYPFLRKGVDGPSTEEADRLTRREIPPDMTEGDAIAAGLATDPMTWKVVNMPGARGTLMDVVKQRTEQLKKEAEVQQKKDDAAQKEIEAARKREMQDIAARHDSLLTLGDVSMAEEIERLLINEGFGEIVEKKKLVEKRLAKTKELEKKAEEAKAALEKNLGLLDEKHVSEELRESEKEILKDESSMTEEQISKAIDGTFGSLADDVLETVKDLRARVKSALKGVAKKDALPEARAFAKAPNGQFFEIADDGNGKLVAKPIASPEGRVEEGDLEVLDEMQARAKTYDVSDFNSQVVARRAAMPLLLGRDRLSDVESRLEQHEKANALERKAKEGDFTVRFEGATWDVKAEEGEVAVTRRPTAEEKKAQREKKKKEKAAATDEAARDEVFDQLATLQRNAPETAMVALQDAAGGGTYSALVEAVGDLTHRMGERVTAHDRGYEAVMQKVPPSLRSLLRDGAEKSILGEIERNHRSGEKSATKENFDRARTKYADAHAALPVYNEAQWHAREAAVALGLLNFKEAAEHLKALTAHLGTSEAWTDHANEYSAEFKPPSNWRIGDSKRDGGTDTITIQEKDEDGGWVDEVGATGASWMVLDTKVELWAQEVDHDSWRIKPDTETAPDVDMDATEEAETTEPASEPVAEPTETKKELAARAGQLIKDRKLDEAEALIRAKRLWSEKATEKSKLPLKDVLRREKKRVRDEAIKKPMDKLKAIVKRNRPKASVVTQRDLDQIEALAEEHGLWDEKATKHATVRQTHEFLVDKRKKQAEDRKQNLLAESNEKRRIAARDATMERLTKALRDGNLAEAAALLKKDESLLGERVHWKRKLGMGVTETTYRTVRSIFTELQTRSTTKAAEQRAKPKPEPKPAPQAQPEAQAEAEEEASTEEQERAEPAPAPVAEKVEEKTPTTPEEIAALKGQRKWTYLRLKGSNAFQGLPRRRRSKINAIFKRFFEYKRSNPIKYFMEKGDSTERAGVLVHGLLYMKYGEPTLKQDGFTIRDAMEAEIARGKDIFDLSVADHVDEWLDNEPTTEQKRKLAAAILAEGVWGKAFNEFIETGELLHSAPTNTQVTEAKSEILFEPNKYVLGVILSKMGGNLNHVAWKAARARQPMAPFGLVEGERAPVTGLLAKEGDYDAFRTAQLTYAQRLATALLLGLDIHPDGFEPTMLRLVDGEIKTRPFTVPNEKGEDSAEIDYLKLYITRGKEAMTGLGTPAQFRTLSKELEGVAPRQIKPTVLKQLQRNVARSLRQAANVVPQLASGDQAILTDQDIVEPQFDPSIDEEFDGPIDEARGFLEPLQALTNADNNTPAEISRRIDRFSHAIRELMSEFGLDNIHGRHDGVRLANASSFLKTQASTMAHYLLGATADPALLVEATAALESMRRAAMEADFEGAVITLPFTNIHVIVVSDGLLASDGWAHVLGHEVGHVIKNMSWHEAASDERLAVTQDYLKWKASTTGMTQAEILNSKRLLNTLQSEKLTKIPNDVLVDFDEWFADQVSGHVFNRLQSLSKTSRGFFARVAEAIKWLRRTIIEKFSRSGMPSRPVGSYLDALKARGVTTPVFPTALVPQHIVGAKSYDALKDLSAEQRKKAKEKAEKNPSLPGEDDVIATANATKRRLAQEIRDADKARAAAILGEMRAVMETEATDTDGEWEKFLKTGRERYEGWAAQWFANRYLVPYITRMRADGFHRLAGWGETHAVVGRVAANQLYTEFEKVLRATKHQVALRKAGSEWFGVWAGGLNLDELQVAMKKRAAEDAKKAIKKGEDPKKAGHAARESIERIKKARAALSKLTGIKDFNPATHLKWRMTDSGRAVFDEDITHQSSKTQEILREMAKLANVWHAMDHAVKSRHEKAALNQSEKRLPVPHWPERMRHDLWMERRVEKAAPRELGEGGGSYVDIFQTYTAIKGVTLGSLSEERTDALFFNEVDWGMGSSMQYVRQGMQDVVKYEWWGRPTINKNKDSPHYGERGYWPGQKHEDEEGGTERPGTPDSEIARHVAEEARRLGVPHADAKLFAMTVIGLLPEGSFNDDFNSSLRIIVNMLYGTLLSSPVQGLRNATQPAVLGSTWGVSYLVKAMAKHYPGAFSRFVREAAALPRGKIGARYRVPLSKIQQANLMAGAVESDMEGYLSQFGANEHALTKMEGYSRTFAETLMYVSGFSWWETQNRHVSGEIGAMVVRKKLNVLANTDVGRAIRMGQPVTNKMSRRGRKALAVIEQDFRYDILKIQEILRSGRITEADLYLARFWASRKINPRGDLLQQPEFMVTSPQKGVKQAFKQFKSFPIGMAISTYDLVVSKAIKWLTSLGREGDIMPAFRVLASSYLAADIYKLIVSTMVPKPEEDDFTEEMVVELLADPKTPEQKKFARGIDHFLDNMKTVGLFSLAERPETFLTVMGWLGPAASLLQDVGLAIGGLADRQNVTLAEVAHEGNRLLERYVTGYRFVKQHFRSQDDVKRRFDLARSVSRIYADNHDTAPWLTKAITPRPAQTRAGDKYELEKATEAMLENDIGAAREWVRKGVIRHAVREKVSLEEAMKSWRARVRQAGPTREVGSSDEKLQKLAFWIKHTYEPSGLKPVAGSSTVLPLEPDQMAREVILAGLHWRAMTELVFGEFR